ncbi:MAG: hypothetical protein AAF483_05225 [Planctomycetota bacterium]
MRRERFAASLILLAFFSGMLLTAATSGCDAKNNLTAQNDAEQNSPSSTEDNK